MHYYYYYFVLFYFLLLIIMPVLAGGLLFTRNGKSLKLTSCKKGFLERRHVVSNLGRRAYYLDTFRTGHSLLSTLSVMEFLPLHICSGSLSTGWIPQLTLTSRVPVPAQTLSHVHFA